MDVYLEDLKRKTLEAENRMHEIVETAEKRGDGLTAEENANLEKWDKDWTGYKAEEKRLVDLRDKIGPAGQRLAESVERAAVDDGFDFSRFLGGTDDKEQRTFYTARSVPVGAYSSDPRIRAIQSQEAERFAQRALQAGGGGSAVETSFADFVTVYERTLNPMIEVSTVLSTGNGSPIVLPRLTADVVSSGTVTAEGAGITEGDPTISQVTISAWKRAFTTLWSAELDQDEIIGVEGLIANSIARHVGLAWGTAFTSGNDSSEAHGYVTAIGTVAQRGTALGTADGNATDTFFSAADLIGQFYLLAAPYRLNASWLVSNTALAKMAKFRDSTGNFLYTSSQVVGTPDNFLRRPVFENPALAAVASASVSVTVGDFSKYIIREVVPVRVDRSIEYKFNTDQVALRYITRRDGDLPDTISIRALQSANT